MRSCSDTDIYAVFPSPTVKCSLNRKANVFLKVALFTS